jgi:Cysteine-rich secretory protein family
MFHVKQLIVIVLISISFSASSQGVLTLQDKPFVINLPIDSGLYKSISSSGPFGLLSQTERESLYWINYFRQNPRRFWNSVMKEFLLQFPEAKSPYTRSLEADILKAPQSLPLLAPDSGLIRMASVHAEDLKKRNGIISHSSSGGRTFVQRIQAAGRYTCGAENIFNGSFNGLESLIALLIDHGVADKGHRLNLLDPKFQLIGVSFIAFTPGKGILVQDFACR